MSRYSSRAHRLLHRLWRRFRSRNEFWDPETISWAAANEVGKLRPEEEQ